METKEYVARYFKDVDSRDVRRILSNMTEDCRFTFCNTPPLIGHNAIEGYLGGFMGTIAGLAHETEDIWAVDETVIVRQKVTFTRKDQSRVSYPAATIWRLRGGLISELQVFTDLSQL